MPLSTCRLAGLIAVLSGHLGHGLAIRGQANSSSITWGKCDGEVPSSVECGRLTVPLDHYHPDKGTIELGMKRLKANGSSPQGSLLFNGGGPGLPSSTLIVSQAAWEAESNPGGLPVFTTRLRSTFDLVGLDMRGEGSSNPLVCDKDIYNQRVTNIALDDESFDKLVAHNKAFAESCDRLTGPLFRLMGTDQKIRDLDLVRQGVGSEKLNWVGWSGGTQIGAEYAELYPEKLGRMALDGNNARDISDAESILSEATALESGLNHFFRWCDEATECALHGQDVGALFDHLLEEADRGPLPAPSARDSDKLDDTVSVEDLLSGVLNHLNSGVDSKPKKGAQNYQTLAEGLKAARDGDASAFALTRATTNMANDEEFMFSHINSLCSDYTRDHLRSAADLRSIFLPARFLTPRSRGISVSKFAPFRPPFHVLSFSPPLPSPPSLPPC